jgi:ABC-type sugar transport system substrate-binding protein
MVEASILLGYFNYVLDIAPEAERSTYIGLTNTLAGLLAAAPLVGGWILEQTSYTFLFGLTAILVLPGVLVALTLPKPGQQPQL